MTWWQAALLGLVEGITEYLPVSSTGHLILTSSLLGLAQSRAVADLEVVIQGGAILAVLGLYRERVRGMLAGLVGRDPEGRRLFVCLVVAFIPAALAGFALKHHIQEHLFDAAHVLGALAVGGVVMILSEPWLRRRTGWPSASLASLTPKQALVIGLLQCLALWPGTSRAMVTMLGGVLVGLPVVEAAELSFLLGLPTLGAASAYALLSNVREAAKTGAPNLFEQLGVGPTVIGFGVATVAAAFAVRWLVAFLGRRGMAPFGWYRIVLAAGLGAAAALGYLEIRPG